MRPGGTAPGTSEPEAEDPGELLLRMPADRSFVTVLRTTAASLGALADLPLDAVEDLRTAVGEAASLVLDRTAAGSVVTVVFWMREEGIRVRIRGESRVGAELDRAGFGWQVLSMLAEDVVGETGATGVSVALTIARGAQR